MQDDWLQALNLDPLPTLLSWSDPALVYQARRDLLDEAVEPIRSLWDLDGALLLAKKQCEDGSWRYPGKSHAPQTGTNYVLLQTFRNLRVLVQMYGFNRGHPTLSSAAEYVFSCQTAEGDIRGIIGNQYMPYYHGAILALLIEAGYAEDGRVIRGLDWLLSVRQDDGGWVVPAQLVPANAKTGRFWRGQPLPPERDKPSSHLATGMVLRAFAAHPAYRERDEIIAAARLLKGRIFRPDCYNDRKAPAYWLKFQYPFWWTDLLNTLDILGKLGFEGADPDIERGLVWFLSNQTPDGLWDTGYGSGKRAEENRRWVGLAICRGLQHFYSQ